MNELNVNDSQFLYVEKYRPQTIEECILPESLKETFKEFIKSGQVPNFLFSGTAGVGKTTIAKALCNEIGAEFLMINGSDEGRQIDTLRTSIRGFASTVSLTDSKKVVIIDEADYMNATSIQPALRGFIEEFSSNCRFILTCNFKNRIIEPLHSRCTCIDFKIDSKDKQHIAASFFKRATTILKAENIEFDQKVVAELVTKHFPDYRRILNELQRYSVSGKIDAGILVNTTDETFSPLLKMLKEKNFTEVRKWVGVNSDIESTELFRRLYDKSVEYIEMTSIPQLVLILADYGYKNAFVTDREINTMACLTEVMSSCSFK
jgi:DNA polymerase III delta prime subunit